MKGPKTLCAMIDMSRNAVMNLPSLKAFIRILRKFGYNSIMLYTEDTYEVEGEPYFGYMRGRYSIAEMQEIDEYAASLGIEVIPCIQTLAHLNAFLKWGKTPKDIDDILLADDGRTYELIEKMLATLSKCFRSRRIHLGMDEAANIGRGRHLNEYGYEPAVDIVRRHLVRVNDIAKKYGYTPMIWADMLFRSWNNNNYYIPKCEIPENIKNSIPQGVIAIYWDYYHREQQEYEDSIDNHLQITKDVYFAGGLWCWTGMVPQNRFSLDTMLPAMRACRKYKIKDIIMTLWGDDGGECSHFSQLPALLHIAEAARGNFDEEKIKAKFSRLIGLDYDDFMKLDLPNEICENIGRRNPSKYMLYSDLFNGYLDYTVAEGAEDKYREYAKALSAVAKKTRKWRYLFDTEAKLCELLSYKYELGVKTRKAYQAGNKAELDRLVKEYYTPLISAVKMFYKAYSKQWYLENKGSGFDIQDLRLGGLAGRVSACRARIVDYVTGKIDRIEELECEILPFGGTERGEPILCNGFRNYGPVNVISH